MNKDDLTGLNRLLFAAVVDSDFRRLLLNHPGIAVEMKFNQEVLRLTPDAKRMASSIQTKSLKQFAKRLISPRQGVMPDEAKIEDEPLREARFATPND